MDSSQVDLPATPKSFIQLFGINDELLGSNPPERNIPSTLNFHAEPKLLHGGSPIGVPSDRKAKLPTKNAATETRALFDTPSIIEFLAFSCPKKTHYVSRMETLEFQLDGVHILTVAFKHSRYRGCSAVLYAHKKTTFWSPREHPISANNPIVAKNV